MRKLTIVIIGTAVLLAGCITSKNMHIRYLSEGEVIEKVDLPQNIKNYISIKYPKQKVIKYTKRYVKYFGIDDGIRYKVELYNGKTLSFDENGKIIE